jgi:hypothetical protein
MLFKGDVKNVSEKIVWSREFIKDFSLKRSLWPFLGESHGGLLSFYDVIIS